MTRLHGVLPGLVIALFPLAGLAQVDDMPPLPAEPTFYQDWVLVILDLTPWLAGILGLLACILLHWWKSRRLALTWTGESPTGWSFWALPVGLATLLYVVVCFGVMIPGIVIDPVFKDHVRQNFDWPTGGMWILPLFVLTWIPMILRLLFPAKRAS